VGVDEPFDTEKVTGADVVTFPAASRAIARTVCDPLETAVEFHVTEYGDAVSGCPTLAPSTVNCTDVTPSSSAAVALSATEPETVVPDPGAVTETVGATASRVTLFTVTQTVAELATLPAASRAKAAITCDPLATAVEDQEMP
jgi:hypothetical protein